MRIEHALRVVAAGSARGRAACVVDAYHLTSTSRARGVRLYQALTTLDKTNFSSIETRVPLLYMSGCGDWHVRIASHGPLRILR